MARGAERALPRPPNRMSSLLAKSLARIKPSATIAVTDAARQLKADGHDVIGLGAGEPDFDTPDHIKAAAAEAMRAGKTKYTAVGGIAELKQAICDKLQRENGLAHAPDEVLVSPGGKAVVYNAMMASLNAGDEVVIPAPYWVSYPDIVRLAGGTPVLLEAGHEQGFKLGAAELAGALTARTKWVILNSPSNPTGAAYTHAELAALLAPLSDHPQVHVLSDEIYEHLVYGDFVFTSAARAAPELAARTLTVNGVSKAFAMTGWRIGYGAGPAPLIKAMTKIQSQSTSNPTSISQWAAVAALNGPTDFLGAWRQSFQARRNLVVAELNASEGLSCTMPSGAFYAYPNWAGLKGKTSKGGARLTNDVAFAQALLKEAGVAIVPGEAFGMSPYFRLSYATSEELLRDALARIAGFCASCA